GSAAVVPTLSHRRKPCDAGVKRNSDEGSGSSGRQARVSRAPVPMASSEKLALGTVDSTFASLDSGFARTNQPAREGIPFARPCRLRPCVVAFAPSFL